MAGEQLFDTLFQSAQHKNYHSALLHKFAAGKLTTCLPYNTPHGTTLLSNSLLLLLLLLFCC
jgi:hypothetical protein